MRVLEFSDAHHFLERARGFLLSDEFRHNLLLSSALALSKSTSRPPTPTRAPSLIFLATETQDGAALRSPNHRWIVAAQNNQAIQALAAHIATRESQAQTSFRGVMLAGDWVPTFCQAFQAPFALQTRSTQNLMVLTRLKPVEPSEGLFRFALPKDLKALSKWSQRFAEETGIDESPKEAEEIVQKYFDSKQLFVWDNKGRATAMAAVGGFTPHGARLSMVYTDPVERGKGYASTLVHRLSHKVMQDGKSCVLFADTLNLRTQKIYETLGYQTLCSFAELKAQL